MDQLPVELFHDIIVQSLDSWPTRTDPARLEALRTLSRSWSTRILSNQRSWAIIHPIYAQTEGRLLKMLERSGEAPLTIYAYGYRQDAEPVMRAVASLSERWRHLEMSAPTAVMEAWLSCPAPTLETAWLGSSGVEGEVIFRNLFGGNAPRLRSLKTCLISSLLINKAILQNIEHLALIIPHSHIPAACPTGLNAIIPSCPKLRTLEFSFDNSHLNIRGSYTFPERLILPPLQSLRINIHPKVLHTLIANLNGANCPVIQIEEFQGSWYGVDSFKVLCDAVQPLLQEYGALTAELNNHGLSLRPYAGGAQVQFCVRSNPTLGALLLKEAVASLNSPKIVRVEILGSKWHSLEGMLGDGNGSMVALALEAGEFGISSRIWQDEVAIGMSNMHHVLLGFSGDPTRVLRKFQVWERGSWVDRLDEAVAEAVDVVASG